MIDFLFWGVFSLEFVSNNGISGVPILEIARTPLFINLGILGAVIVPFVSQANIRSALTTLSFTCLLLMCGLIFAVCVLTYCIFIFFFARFLQSWSLRRGSHKLPLLTAWLTVNAIYLPIFFVTLPHFGSFMSVGELSLLWGPAFLVFKSLHFSHQACRSQIDFSTDHIFRRYLLYMVHFASFYFGPYQKFSQFDSEVSSCKSRISWRNTGKGAYRILLGAVKMLIIFHLINIDYFYEWSYYGPFADTLFANAPESEPGHLWLMVYLFMLRLTLFMSAISDGVIGMNLMMGIRVPENSKWPLFAPNMIEFWKRWHIQAGVFLRDEVFVPIGGLKNIYKGFFAVFAYSGFWHFPSLGAYLAFPALHLLIFYLTIKWTKFWKKEADNRTNLYSVMKKLYLRDTFLPVVIGAFLVFHFNMLTVLFLHDHFYAGTRILPRMFGLIVSH